jgi:hypothetical protein
VATSKPSWSPGLSRHARTHARVAVRIPLLIVTVACFKTGKVPCSLVCWCLCWCPNQQAGLFGCSKRAARSARVNLRGGFSCGGNLRGCWPGLLRANERLGMSGWILS